MGWNVEAMRDRVAAHGVVVCWVFGSTARGTSTEQSDTDVAVLVSEDREPLDLLEQSRLAQELEDVIGTSVDVVAFERAPLPLRARIVIEGEVVHSTDEALRVRTAVDTLSRWEDLRPVLADMDAAYVGAIARRGLAR